MTGLKYSGSLPQQLGLPIRLNDAATLANFYCLDNSTHHQVVETLSQAQHEGVIYLWGGGGTGVSHLLQASCHYLQEKGQQAQYLPLTELLEYPAEQLLENMEEFSLVCLDDLQVVAGNQQWQLRLFDFFNRIREKGNRLIIGAKCPPRELSLELADLQSRLGWGLVFQLPTLSDEDKLTLLQFRAAQRGIDFANEPARFLIRRSAREMGELIARLDKLEEAAIESRRTLTIPFLKETFGW